MSNTYLKSSVLDADTLGRIQFVSNLDYGWLGNGEGETPSKGSVRAAIQFLEMLQERSSKDRPGIYPLIENGINLEWNDDITNDSWMVEFHNDGIAKLYIFTCVADNELTYQYDDENIHQVIQDIFLQLRKVELA